MADFKTSLERLSRREITFEALAANLDKLLGKKPQAAVAVMEQLKEAVNAEVIDAETYARLRAVVRRNVQTAAEDGSDDARTSFDGGGERTELVDVADHPHTELVGARGEDASDIDFDPTGDTGSGTSSSWSDEVEDDSATSWDQSRRKRGGPQLGPGTVLRGRFQLDEVLGQGGMGSVYLGRDLIKVRARDKQPRVALKVLNEDFKQHPDSFIALQREASRQQRLAHPNIATVYDFDQTEDGTAFLVMELLEGQPLNDFIKRTVKPRGGLPFGEALPMVQGLGNALVYAHERNIVHSDFKPGNCFITRGGEMKVLDFGIARAVKAPGTAEGETTIFDAAKLGALTPAYASLEMLEGKEPDPRDDIYALACVTYELLTGRHPFNKIPANKARDAALAPEPVKGLTRRQWRGLQRGLAFAREDRSQSTAQFLEEFEGATSPWKNPFVMVPAVVALIVIAGFFPARNYLQARDIEQRIALAQSGDPAQVEQMLAGLDADGVGQAARDRIFTAAKEEILGYFDARARASIDIANGHYDFDGARETLATARTLSPVFADSSRLDELRQDIEQSENRLFAEQFDRFNRALAEGRLLAVDGEDDVFDAMEVVRKVDPGHAMLTDRRLPGAYADAINAALDDEEYAYADELSQVGLALIPDSANLANLTDKIAGARDRAETRARILAAIAAIQEAEDAGGSLADYAQVGDAVADLAAADPGNARLQALASALGPRARREIAQLEAGRDWGASELLQGDYRGLLRGLGLHELGTRAAVLGAEFDAAVSRARAAVTAAVADGELVAAGERLARLGALAPASARTANARDQLAQAWLESARRARDADAFDRARSALESALQVAPGGAITRRLEEERIRLDSLAPLDAAALDAARAERQQRFEATLPAFVAQVEALGTERGAYAEAFAARDALAALAPGAPALEDASRQLDAAVRAGAGRMGAAGAWDDAVTLTRAALVELPASTALAESLASVEQSRDEARRAAEQGQVAEAKARIETLLEEPVADRDWRAAARGAMETIYALGEPGDDWLADYGARLAGVYIERAARMRAEQRFAEGA
ncbi:MAG: serine/threonine-protein kinase, partial [Gammaproteobacteria bacterium]